MAVPPETTFQSVAPTVKHPDHKPVPCGLCPYTSPSLLNDPGYEFVFKRDSTSILHVQVENPSDPLMKKATRQEWHFDATTYLPLRVVYDVRDVMSPATTIKASCDYLQFQPIDIGIVVPVQMKLYETGDLVEATTVDSVRINDIVEQGFDVPQEDS